MKKTIAFLLSVFTFLILMQMTPFAASGDIAGVYYSTDIKTYLNGAEIDSINIGGQTLVSAEDMHYYSFCVNWYAEERMLCVDEISHAGNGVPPQIDKSQYTAGTTLGYYYDTDIVTKLDGQPITAYNVGGRTYIHAEEMRKAGYVVNWYENERKLEITSRLRTGYVYDIGMSYAEDKFISPQEPGEESLGKAYVKYTPDKLVGRNDADFFDLTMRASGKDYVFDLRFYQNKALFNSTTIIDTLRPICYTGFSVDDAYEKSEKYDLVNKTITIEINGQKANRVSVISGAGNGHRDFYFVAEDLPRFKKDEIAEIIFIIGMPDGKEYTINVPDYVTNSPDNFIEKLKKYPNDWMHTYYMANDYYIYFMKESASLGLVKDRLYIVNISTGDISEDILEQVRQIEGFNYDVINPFAFNIGDMKNNFFFSCSSPEAVKDFYVELDSGIVHLR